MQERFPFEMPPEITEQPAPVEETTVQPEPAVKPVVEDAVVEEENTPLPDADENCNGSGEVKAEPEPVKEETPKQELIAEEVREEPVIQNVENEVDGQDINQEEEQPLPPKIEVEEAAINAEELVEERGDDNNEDNKVEEEVAPIVEEQVNEREEGNEPSEIEDASESGPMELENDKDEDEEDDEDNESVEEEGLDIEHEQDEDEDNSEEQGMEVENDSDNDKEQEPSDMDNGSNQQERGEEALSNNSGPEVRPEEIKEPSIQKEEEIKEQEEQVVEEAESVKQEEEPAPVIEQPEPESKKSSVQAKEEEEIVEEPQLAKREEMNPVKEPSEQEEEIEEEPEPVSVKSVRFDNLRAHTLRHLKKRVLNTPSRVVYEPDSVINRNYFKQSSVSHIPPQTYKGEPTTKQLSLNKLKQEVTSLYKARRMGVPVPAVYSINLKQRVLCTEIFTNTESLANYLRTKVDFSNENIQKELKKVFNTLGEYLAELHNGNVIHGNLNNEAVLVSTTSQRLKFVDFSESYSSGNIEDKAKDLYKFEQSLLGGKQDNAVVGELMQFLCTGYITKSKKFDSIIQRLRKIKLRSGN